MSDIHRLRASVSPQQGPSDSGLMVETEQTSKAPSLCAAIQLRAFASPSECLPPHETSMTRAAIRRYRPRPNPLLFRVAFARARPCYCYGCICLTPEERAYERRVFKLAH